MAQTNSIAFPDMIDAARNRVAVIEDDESIVNRTRLLFLTEPTELYHNPDFGVGLRRYIFQYNTENVKALIKDKMKNQLLLHEPEVDSEATQFVDGLLFTGGDVPESPQDYNRLKMTVGLTTIYGDKLTIDLNDEYKNIG